MYGCNQGYRQDNRRQGEGDTRGLTSVLGYNLDAAAKLLREEGFCVSALEISAIKRIDDGEPRVIRQTLLKDGIVLLEYSLFRTSVQNAEQA